MSEAIELVEVNRDPDGRWPLQNVYPGEVDLEMEDGEGRRAAGTRSARCASSTGSHRAVELAVTPVSPRHLDVGCALRP